MRYSLLLLLIAGCASGSGTNTIDPDPPSEDPKVIKITYLHFMKQYDPQTRANRMQHFYHCMLSDGWTQKRGGSPQEPLARMYRDMFFSDSVPDRSMQQLVDFAMQSGWEQLRATPPELINLESLRRMERMNDPALARQRILTIETEAGKKTVTFYDNDDSRGGKPGPQLMVFLTIERQVVSFASGNTIQVTVEKTPASPR